MFVALLVLLITSLAEKLPSSCRHIWKKTKREDGKERIVLDPEL